jgi:hypothetical protein
MNLHARIAVAGLALAAFGAVAGAHSLPRERLTLGRLADDCDVVAVGRVDRVAGRTATFVVEELLKGEPATELLVPIAPDVPFTLGERIVLFLRVGEDGRLLAPETVFEKLVLDGKTPAHVLVEAVRRRLPRLGGPPASTAALFADLECRDERIRDDAALEILAHVSLEAGEPEHLALGRAIRARATPELLAIAGRLGGESLLAPVLEAARAATDPRMSEAAGRALAAIGAAIEPLVEDLAPPDSGQAIRSARALGAMGTDASARALGERLGDERRDVRLAALDGLARSRRAEVVASALERVVEARDHDEAARAAAILARAGAGASLARVAASGDAETRALVARLRADPVRASREVLDDSRW